MNRILAIAEFWAVILVALAAVLWILRMAFHRDPDPAANALLQRAHRGEVFLCEPVTESWRDVRVECRMCRQDGVRNDALFAVVAGQCYGMVCMRHAETMMVQWWTSRLNLKQQFIPGRLAVPELRER
jgi:hypothetical protein